MRLLKFPFYVTIQSVLAGLYMGFSGGAIHTLLQHSVSQTVKAGMVFFFGAALVVLSVFGSSSKYPDKPRRTLCHSIICLVIIFFSVCYMVWRLLPGQFPSPFEGEWSPWKMVAKDLGILWAMLAVFTLPWYAQSIEDDLLRTNAQKMSLPLVPGGFLVAGLAIFGIMLEIPGFLSFRDHHIWRNQFAFLLVCRDIALFAMTMNIIFWRLHRMENTNYPYLWRFRPH